MATSTGIDNPAMVSDRLDYEDENNKYKNERQQSDHNNKDTTNQSTDKDSTSSPQRTDDVDFNALQIVSRRKKIQKNIFHWVSYIIHSHSS